MARHVPVRLLAVVAVVAVLAVGIVQFRPQSQHERTANRVAPTLAQTVSTFENTPASAARFAAYNTALVNAAAASPDRAAFWAHVDAAEAAGFRGATTIAALAQTSKSLAGTVTEVHRPPAPSASVNGRPVRPVGDNTPLLKVYYLDETLSTRDTADADTARLVDTLGVDVENYHDASAVDTTPDQREWCVDAVTSLLESERQRELLAALNRDNEDAEAIQQAAGKGKLRWLWEAMTRSVGGALQDGTDKYVSGSLSLAEYLLAKACHTEQGIDEAFSSEEHFASYLSNLVGNWGSALVERLAVAIDDTHSYDHELVDMIERDLEAGRRVVLIGHSRGSLIAELALAEVNRWWAETRIPAVCPPNSVLQIAAPIAALYVAPAFTATSDDQQGNVMLDGDVLVTSHLGGTPTTPPSGDQVGLTSRDLHRMATYLEPGSRSAARIRSVFGRLEHHVLSVPSAQDSCPGSSLDTSTTESPNDSTTTDTENPNVVQNLTGRFVDDTSSRFPRHYRVNSISLAVGKDGTVTGSYSVVFWIDWKYAYEVPTKCIETYRASGELVLDPGQTVGKIENISESREHDGCPDFNGDWSHSAGGWRLNNLQQGEADGGVDVQAMGIGFVVRG